MSRFGQNLREEGYRRFQLKVGSAADDDIARIRAARSILADTDVLIADANTGWQSHEAMRVVNAVADLDVYIEQPCYSYEECLSIRERTKLPFILDENIDGLPQLLRAHADRAVDAINLKISKVGGLSKARVIRDVCVGLGLPMTILGLPMTIEDSWGGDIITAAISHLAHSTPERNCFSSTDFNSYVSVSNASGAPLRENGFMRASEDPGLGITPNWDGLGEPVFEIRG